MPLSDTHLRFLDTFGYLVLPGLLREDIAWISAEFDRIWGDRDRGRVGHRGSHEVMPVVPFIDQSERLATLLEHPALEPALERAVGPGFNYLSGDGRVYHGDTTWHWDADAPPQTPFFKAAVYLDPLTRDSGALRVIPGTHRLADAYAQRARAANRCQAELGIAAHEVPCVALETRPGDVILFHQNLVHGSCGGGDRRRMFAINLAPRAETEEQLAALRGYLGYHLAPWGERAHGSLMRANASPTRLRHLAQVIEQEGHLPALHRAWQERRRAPQVATAKS
jgi:hypothetical protein